MLKVQYVSDLHTEFMHRVSEVTSLAQEIISGGDGADVLILAGDIGAMTNTSSLFAFIEEICPAYKHVLYVPGNHEYYSLPGGKLCDVVQVRSQLSRDNPSLRILNNETELIDGYAFACTTLWFDPTSPDAILRRGYLNDFRYVPGGAEWIEMQNKASLDYLKRLVVDERRIDVLITHHGVSTQAHDRHRGDKNNIFFYTDISAIVEHLDIGYIIHGHQHSNHTYELPCNIKHSPEQRVPVLMNAKGYAGEGENGFSFSKCIYLG